MKEKFVEVNRFNIRYLEDGNSDRTIVLLHGLGGYAERWNNLFPFLSKKYRVIAPDLIGYGQSDKPSVDYTPEFFTKFVFNFMNAVGIKKTFLIGTSLGGQIVIECAASQNDIIEKIILISPAGIMRKSTPTLDAYTMAALYPNKDSVKNAYQMMVGPGKQISETSVERFVNNMSRPNAKMVFLSTLLGLKNAPDIHDKLASITIPTLVIWGRDDKLIPFEYSQQFVSTIPNCEFVAMDGCGHSPYVEDPEELAKIITKFLSARHQG
ncbi:Alpha/beta hydrolase [Nitrosotalea sinensis]|jgi:pimeloyl-ACP methyl ester carboxylesterase|uniref:Alpha/beta hydrolase n=1 Tax=Nitrosotalea sinensis TaxID=1499975 RepID=A0A2H1EGW1_9ARCH|nr:alpha/beta hydrolase [Candidatus Nitrosotalea sinensis]SHO45806.1 Alpha/beta hydrolase [Candidatus Nitrosotalea sinensis]